MQLLQETAETADLWDIYSILINYVLICSQCTCKIHLGKISFWKMQKDRLIMSKPCFACFAHILMTPNNFQESQFISTNRSRQIAPLVENQMQPRYYRHHADPIVGGFRSSPPQSHICKYVCVYAHIQVQLSFLPFFSVYKGSTYLTETITVTQIQDFWDLQKGVRIANSSWGGN